MAKYAPVAPIALLAHLKEIGALGDYQLFLAHDVLNNVHAYEALLHDIDPFIILDNSAVELGEPITGHSLLAAADIVGASCVALPDKLRDQQGTLELVTTFLRDITYEDVKTYKWMAIPQGSTFDEIFQCIDTLYTRYTDIISYWGIPRWVANDLGSRMPVIEYIIRQCPSKFSDPYIHMLGMSRKYNDDLKCLQDPKYHKYVMGIDSANPLVLGQNHKAFFHDYEHMDRGDYWEQNKLTPRAVMNILQLRSVI